MASLSEMMQYAEWKSRDHVENTLGGKLSRLAASAISGVEAGMGDKVKREDRQLDRAGKLLAIQKDQEEMAAAAENRRIMKSFAQRAGIIPLDPDQSDAARGVAIDGLGGGPKRPDDNSNGGRMGRFFMGKDEYRINPKMGKDGMSFDFNYIDPKKGADDASQEQARTAEFQQKVRAAATEAARRDKINWIQKFQPEMFNGDKADTEAKLGQIQPDESEVQSYLPEFESYYKGDTASYASKKTGREASRGKRAKAISGIDSELSGLKARGKDWVPFNENPADEEILGEMRSGLISGDLSSARARVEKELGSVQGQKGDKAMARQKALTRRLIEISRMGGSR